MTSPRDDEFFLAHERLAAAERAVASAQAEVDCLVGRYGPRESDKTQLRKHRTKKVLFTVWYVFALFVIALFALAVSFSLPVTLSFSGGQTFSRIPLSLTTGLWAGLVWTVALFAGNRNRRTTHWSLSRTGVAAAVAAATTAVPFAVMLGGYHELLATQALVNLVTLGTVFSSALSARWLKEAGPATTGLFIGTVALWLSGWYGPAPTDPSFGFLDVPLPVILLPVTTLVLIGQNQCFWFTRFVAGALAMGWSLAAACSIIYPGFAGVFPEETPWAADTRMLIMFASALVLTIRSVSILSQKKRVLHWSDSWSLVTTPTMVLFCSAAVALDPMNSPLVLLLPILGFFTFALAAHATHRIDDFLPTRQDQQRKQKSKSKKKHPHHSHLEQVSSSATNRTMAASFSSTGLEIIALGLVVITIQAALAGINLSLLILRSTAAGALFSIIALIVFVVNQRSGSQNVSATGWWVWTAAGAVAHTPVLCDIWRTRILWLGGIQSLFDGVATMMLLFALGVAAARGTRPPGVILQGIVLVTAMATSIAAVTTLVVATTELVSSGTPIRTVFFVAQGVVSVLWIVIGFIFAVIARFTAPGQRHTAPLAITLICAGSLKLVVFDLPHLLAITRIGAVILIMIMGLTATFIAAQSHHRRNAAHAIDGPIIWDLHKTGYNTTAMLGRKTPGSQFSSLWASPYSLETKQEQLSQPPSEQYSPTKPASRAPISDMTPQRTSGTKQQTPTGEDVPAEPRTYRIIIRPDADETGTPSL